MPELRHSEVNPVAVAHTLEEVRSAIRRRERVPLRAVLLRAWVRLRVALTNGLLSLLRAALFKTGGLRGTEFRRIVVYTVGILGDNVVMLPALAAIRRRWPSALITVITNCQKWNPRAAREIFAGLPFLDQQFIVNDHLVRRIGMRLILDRGQLGDVACDLFVNLSPFGNRGWLGAVFRELALARMLHATHAVGFSVSTIARSPLLRNIYPHLLKNEPRRAAEVLKPLGIQPLAWAEAMPTRPDARDSVWKKLAALGIHDEPFAVLHPGAKFRTQRWPSRQFGTLARELQKQQRMPIVVTGANEEKAIVEEVLAASENGAVSLVGQTDIAEMIELLRLARLCVTNDTGAMHLAAAVGVPTVAIVSTRNTPAHWFPDSENVVALFRICPCSYCYLEDSGCDHLQCLTGIGVGDVLDAVRAVLSRTASTAGRKGERPLVDHGVEPRSGNEQNAAKHI
jgi:ADP-heptose:LPS heptosyltransferase